MYILGMGRLTDMYRYAVMRVHDASASVEQQRMNEILEANRDASVFARCIGFSEIQLIILIQNVFLYLLTSVVNLFWAHNLIDLHKVGLSNGFADVYTTTQCISCADEASDAPKGNVSCREAQKQTCRMPR